MTDDGGMAVRPGLLMGASLGVINVSLMLAMDRMLGRSGDVGWYSYSPMTRRYSDYLPPDHIVNGRLALALVLAVLVVVNSVAVVAYLKVHDRGRRPD